MNGPVAAIGSPNSGDIGVYFSYSSDLLLAEDVYHVATNAWAGPTLVTDTQGFARELLSPTQPTAVGGPNPGNQAIFFNCCSGSLVPEPGGGFERVGPLDDLDMAYFLASTRTWTFSTLANPIT